MLACKELYLLFLPNCNKFEWDRMTVHVGGGASRTIREATGATYTKCETYSQKELQRQLSSVHLALLTKLDMPLILYICPRGWQICLTEHAACEKRKFNEACESGTRFKRRKSEEVERKHIQRSRRLSCCWRVVGFREQPLPDSYLTRLEATNRVRFLN